MIKYGLLAFVFLFFFSCFYEVKGVNFDKAQSFQGKYAYVSSAYSRLHIDQDIVSATLALLKCGTRLELLPNSRLKKGMANIQVQGKEGFILKRNIVFSQNTLDCFEKKYPYFSDEIGLKLSDREYLGILEDYLRATTQVQ